MLFLAKGLRESAGQEPFEGASGTTISASFFDEASWTDHQLCPKHIFAKVSFPVFFVVFFSMRNVAIWESRPALCNVGRRMHTKEQERAWSGKKKPCALNIPIYRMLGWLSLPVERRSHNPKVASSILAPGISLFLFFLFSFLLSYGCQHLSFQPVGVQGGSGQKRKRPEMQAQHLLSLRGHH
jgi:hypothetical protein